MSHTLGEKRARELWAEVGKVPRGKMPGQVMYPDQALIIRLYDEMRKESPTDNLTMGEFARELGEFLHNKFPGNHGTSALAIAKRAVRILKRRDDSRRDRALALGKALLDYPSHSISPEDPAGHKRGQ